MSDFSQLKRLGFEKGVLIAFIATAGMGMMNYSYGFGARSTSPLMINWFVSVVTAIISFLYIACKRELGKVLSLARENVGLVIALSIPGNAAWIFYSYSMVYIPIALATGITESSIALAALLGLIISRERLRFHQSVGLVITVIAAIILGATL